MLLFIYSDLKPLKVIDPEAPNKSVPLRGVRIAANPPRVQRHSDAHHLTPTTTETPSPYSQHTHGTEHETGSHSHLPSSLSQTGSHIGFACPCPDGLRGVEYDSLARDSLSLLVIRGLFGYRRSEHACPASRCSSLFSSLLFCWINRRTLPPHLARDSIPACTSLTKGSRGESADPAGGLGVGLLSRVQRTDKGDWSCIGRGKGVEGRA